MGKGKEIDTASGGATGTFEDPHKLTFSIKDLPANSVVLYPDQAQITRDIENVQLKPGVNEVTIKDLTGYCQEHSIKVEGKGDAIITDMVVETVWFTRPPGQGLFGQRAQTGFSDDSSESEDSESESESELDPEEDPAFAEIRQIDKDIKEIRASAQDAAEELKNAEVQLGALEKYGGTITAEVAAPETMTQFLDAYQESRKILYKQHKAAKATLEKLDKNLVAKQKERAKKLKGPTAAKLKAVRDKAKSKAKKTEAKREKREQKEAERRLRPGNSYRVKVMVETNSETEASLTLKYLVYNAKWYPRYDLRLDSTSNTGQIVYRAHFENKTYETWRDAKITFSSSAQTFGGLREVVPVMTPWTLSLQKGFNRFAGDSDNTAGLYSIKEQQALAKKGVLFGNNKQQQQQMQQQANIVQAQQAQINQMNQQPAAKMGGLFGQANNQGLGGFGQPASNQAPPARGLFGAPNSNTIPGASTLGDLPVQGASNPFGGFGATQQAAPGFGQATSLFGQQTQSAFGATGGGLFGGGGAAPPPPPTDVDPSGPANEKPEGDPAAGDDGASTLAPSRASMLIAESSSYESYGMTTAYDISGLKTIKSSPLVRRQVISTIDLPSVIFTSVAVAKLRSAAFLKARFKNASKHTFLRGVAGLTVDGSFLGQTNIPHCPPDDVISLSLGVDTGVHVSYAKPTLVSSSQGFISKENVTLYKRSIFIHNAKSQQLTLTVLDQIPISEDERLRVNVVNPKGLRDGGDPVKTGAPGSTNLDNKWGTASAVMKTAGNGEITYTVKLEKGRSCKLPLEYEVKLPAGEKIVGLT
ncbi:hypothetical protein TWF106_011473 [Orbilia oligospora]|uniref:DUF4139 domain-containing protein n=1 Tax=Orbilia oligospora TaxID=2813651 RepID=A0A7C8QDA9_ORBOL|nr:hypothetical protein TWF788_010027 [Orbilia oligospora]KAF3208240.1 hypothetical protein TWF106_011473 [Orbilia oligospora]